MEKTLVRFFGGAVMVCGTLLGLPTSALAQSFVITADIQDAPVRQPMTEVIHVSNGGQLAANGVSVTLRPPKGAKVDIPCPVDHFAGGFRSYTCFVGTLSPGQTADITFSISMTKSGNDFISVEANGDLVSGGEVFPIRFY